MSGEEDRELAQALGRLQELIAALDALPDPNAKEPARELVALVLDLHGIGLARLVSILASATDGASILARLVEDDQVRSMLLLHGLHPDDFESRVRQAVERLRPHLGVHGLRVEVVEIAAGSVRVRVVPSDGGPIKATLLWSLPGEIEGAIVEAAPDVEEVLIDGLDPPEMAAQASAAE